MINIFLTVVMNCSAIIVKIKKKFKKFDLKSLSPIHFIKIRLPNFLGNEFLVKMYIKFNKITLLKSIPFQRFIISEMNKLFFVVGNKYKFNAKNKRDLDWLELFHQKWKQMISPPPPPLH